MLKAAVEGQLDNASVYTLLWASEIIHDHAGRPPRKVFDLTMTRRVTYLAVFIQIFVPVSVERQECFFA